MWELRKLLNYGGKWSVLIYEFRMPKMSWAAASKLVENIIIVNQPKLLYKQINY